MSFGYATEKNVISKTTDGFVDWVRPSDWLSLTPVGPTEQKFTGLYAIFPDDRRNRVAILCSGATTIDWGDGVVENFNNATQASHQYTYADIPIGTLTSEGFKQVIITVTPQAGQNLSSLNIRQRPNNITAGGFATNWLDIEFGSPNLTSVTIGANNSIASFGLLKRVRFASKAAGYTTFTDFFYLLYAVEEFIIDADMSNALGLNAFFYSCTSLKKAPFFNTSSCTTMAFMFGLCRNLVNIPNYNLQNVTNISSMFDNCGAIKTINLSNIGNVINIGSAFLNCSDLINLPVFNCPNVNSYASTFQGCSNLPSVTILNADKVTSFVLTFANCFSLNNVVIQMNNSNVTTTATMFQNDAVLESAPFFDTSKVTTMASMFIGCRNLVTIPLYNTINNTTMNQTFSSCGILANVPLLNTSNVTNFSSAFSDCTGLIEAPNFDTIKATTVASMFSGCRSLTTIPAYNLSNTTTGGSSILGAPSSVATINLVNIDAFGSRFGTNISNGFLDSVELTQFMENMGIAGATSQTLNIGGNYGADTPITRVGSLTTNSTVITGIGTSGFSVGMIATGTGIITPIIVSCNSTTDRLANTGFSGWSPPEGTMVSVTTTANGLTANRIYYTRNLSSGTFQLSETINGSIVNITGDTNLTMNYDNRIVEINTSASTVTMSLPATVTSAQSLSFRTLNTNIARLKNYTVSG